MPCPPARPTACLPRRTPAKRSTSSKNCGERCASTESATCGAATPKPPVAIERVTPHGRPEAARGVQPGLRGFDGETPGCAGLCGGRTRSKSNGCPAQRGCSATGPRSRRRHDSPLHYWGAVVMYHQPPPLLPFIEVGGQHARFLLLAFRTASAGDVLHAEHPGHVTRHLDHDVGETELHREGVVEDHDPAVADGRPAGSEIPTGMDAGHVVFLAPHLIHLLDVETLEGLVEAFVGLRDLLDHLLAPRGIMDERQSPSGSACPCWCLTISSSKRSSISSEMSSCSDG